MNHVHLRAGGVSVLLDTEGATLPRVLHWGADLGALDDAAVAEVRRASITPPASGTPDEPFELSVVPEQTAGWLATPGVSGHRAGTAFSTAFSVTSLDVAENLDAAGVPLAGRVAVAAHDEVAGLTLAWTLELTVDGLLRHRAAITNTGNDVIGNGIATPPDAVFDLATLDVVLPLPQEAREILDFTGRHLRERQPQRHEFTAGTHLRETRRAHAHDGTLLLLAGEPGFAYTHGEVWGIHVAWSGNVRSFAERAMPSGQAVLGGGELLVPGEIRLAPGESYEGPWVYGSYGRGLTALSRRFHEFLRSRPGHPRTPRKALINCWEAVFFDHDLGRITAIADAASEVGIERFVLDDGWFKGRRGIAAGLGDWYVDEDVYPEGLGPLIAHVTGLGMEFGLWFEPEMINLDSDLARAHPDWVLRLPSRMPVSSKSQQVLDLTVPEAWQYIYDRIHAILSAHDIGFVKWDFNRDLIDAGRQATGTPGIHLQTRAVYRLLAALREAHPDVEFESCASGGGRIDLGILEYTQRVWTSDVLDPLERQVIEAGTGLLLPPELMGSHVSSPRSHSTGRQHDLSFRAATAFFNHFGVEWDLTKASPEDREELACWIALYKEHRALLHSGVALRLDSSDPARRVHGVVSHDLSEAILGIVQLKPGLSHPPAKLRIPGLDPDRTYRVAPLSPGDELLRFRGVWAPAWWAAGIELTGRVLAESGLRAPNQYPEHAAIVRLVAVD
ncbi:MAG TPA: alpha-galactosidase [Arachnia sp.]|nr:alpha-galactosidase [Arachnia sp.]HMT86806.1 alpha-galactosidase [Arachnia sp.]